MPYVIRKRGKQYCVVSTTSGNTHGCHPTKARARAQQRALYANAPEAAGSLLAASGPSTGGVGMVALYPRPEEAKAIAVEGGLAVDDLHVTLVFLGDVGSFDESAVTSAVGDVAASNQALVGEIGGEGHFSINADGIPVILLHGFPYDPRAYDVVVASLVSAGCRVIVPYLRGYGPTRFLAGEVPRSGQQAALGQDLLAELCHIIHNFFFRLLARDDL